MHDVVPATDVRAEVAAALDRFAFRTPWVIEFDGAPIGVAGTPGAAVPAGSPAPLVQTVQAVFYDRCYARRSAVGVAAPGGEPGLAQRLAAANAGRDGWDRGWSVFQIGANGQAFVRKGERERIAVPGAFLTEAMVGMVPQIGATVSLRVPRESLDAQPGYYFAFGETLDELADQLSIVRLYFDVRAEAAPALFAELTGRLNRYQTPFHLKAPVAPAAYDRADAAVLYVGHRYFPIVARIVMAALDRVALDDAVPLFTRRLRPGVGVAMEPGSGESFGSHRSRLVAEGLVEAWQRGEIDGEARLRAVEGRFAAAGVDLARPWLNPGAADRFDLPRAVRLP